MTSRRRKPRPKRTQNRLGLRNALAPFAEVKLPDPGYEDSDCVWLYVGKALGNDHGHLKVEDFRRARREMRR